MYSHWQTLKVDNANVNTLCNMQLKLNRRCVTFFGGEHMGGGWRRVNGWMVLYSAAMWLVPGGSRGTCSAARAAVDGRPGVPRVGAVPGIGSGGGKQSKAIVHSAIAAARSVGHGFAGHICRDVTKDAIYRRHLQRTITINNSNVVWVSLDNWNTNKRLK